MGTLKYSMLESSQVYPDRFGSDFDRYDDGFFYCIRCEKQLPDDSSEYCQVCIKERKEEEEERRSDGDFNYRVSEGKNQK